ncbi:MAG: hypothetical protein KC729_16675, partial [Candidatus Eisenbacteria bacterium]|nr:hypothetical protein [Candidatus Eisenbacteria bacterium]
PGLAAAEPPPGRAALESRSGTGGALILTVGEHHREQPREAVIGVAADGGETAGRMALQRDVASAAA